MTMSQAYAKKLASKGRFGDTMLAHITPEEAQMLKRNGGSGTVNPETGLPEFFLGGLKKNIKRFVPIANVGDGWNAFRDSVQTNAVLAGNYLLPGSSMLTSQLASKGAQDNLNSTFGQLAQAGTGFAGAGVGSSFTGIPSASEAGFGWTNAANGLGGLAGYPTAGTDISSGLSNLFNTSSLSSGTEAARSATSTAATSASSPSSILKGYLPSGGGGSAGGGTSGGFLSNLLGSDQSTTNGASSIFGPNQAVTTSGQLPWLNQAVNQSTTNGASDMLTPRNLLKAGLPFAFGKDNARGFGQIQTSANNAADSYMPLSESGAAATRKLSDFYGLNGQDASASAMGDVQNLPGFQFARDQGVKALDASAATKGMLRSGNQEQAVQDFGTSLAMRYVQDYLDNLSRQQSAGVGAQNSANTARMTAAEAFAASKAGRGKMFNQGLGMLSSYI